MVNPNKSIGLDQKNQMDAADNVGANPLIVICSSMWVSVLWKIPGINGDTARIMIMVKVETVSML
jgi:hypothetical protein